MPDDVRAKFEKWITEPPYECSVERFGDAGSWPGQYIDYTVQLAWEAWEAGHGSHTGG